MNKTIGLSNKDKQFLEKYMDHHEPILLGFDIGDKYVELMFTNEADKHKIQQFSMKYAKTSLGIQSLFYKEAKHKNVEYQTCIIEFSLVSKIDFVSELDNLNIVTKEHQKQILLECCNEVTVSFPILDEEESYMKDTGTYLYSISEFSNMNILDGIVDHIDDNQLPCMLIKNDIQDLTLIDILHKNIKCSDLIGISSKDKTISVSIYLLGYGKKSISLKLDYNETLERSQGVDMLFNYWKTIGQHTTRSDDPFMSKTFCRLLNDMKFYEADYLIIRR